jgi:hypothetical protein
MPAARRHATADIHSRRFCPQNTRVSQARNGSHLLRARARHALCSMSRAADLDAILAEFQSPAPLPQAPLPVRKCSSNDCNAPVKVRGLCMRCYLKQYRNQKNSKDLHPAKLPNNTKDMHPGKAKHRSAQPSLNSRRQRGHVQACLRAQTRKSSFIKPDASPHRVSAIGRSHSLEHRRAIAPQLRTDMLQFLSANPDLRQGSRRTWER